MVPIRPRAEEERHLARHHIPARERRHMPLDRKLAGVVRQAVDRAGKPRMFGHVDEQIVDRRRADRREHRVAIIRGKGQVAHHVSQHVTPAKARGSGFERDGDGRAGGTRCQPSPA